MAANGLAFAPAEVLEAMMTMRSTETDSKRKAHEYLESFQKSPIAWTTTIAILKSDAEADAKLFAATTLKGKITYDLATQLSAQDHAAVRGQVLELLQLYAPGPRPLRVQLCVCLAIVAIQMRDWKDVLPDVVASLGDSVVSHSCILDFLRVLPEEVTEGRKITLSEEDLVERTTELLANNAPRVVQLLINYAHSSVEAATNPQLLECITSWLREVPVSSVVQSPLINVIFNALDNDNSFEAAAECLSTVIRETREVDDNVQIIQALLPRVIALRPKIEECVEEEDMETFKCLTRVFADAGTAWVVAIAREPAPFRPLVDAILECAARDVERDVMEYTFDFWYELKQYLVLERYIQARMELLDVYSKLVDIVIKRLEYPPEHYPAGSRQAADIFEGDRTAEEKFRSYRHQMGDTLKDACEVMGVTECLGKVLEAIKLWTQKYASQTTATTVPQWQELEAPLFSMRAMGRMVGKDENIMLPQLMPLLVQMPSHEKLRFATIMVLGRYTEWTAAHPEFLTAQFNHIVSSFHTDSKEVVRAAAMAIKFFCTDCKHLLGSQIVQLQQFYDQVLDSLPVISQEEVTEGVASVVAVQAPNEIYAYLKLCCDPLVRRLMARANNALTTEGKLAVADHIQLITLFVQIVVVLPPVEHGHDPAVKYWHETFPVLATILENFIDFTPICERVCRCWRYMVISHRGAMTPILPEMADKLAIGFERSRQGCFLWVTGAILREFSDDREHVPQVITDSIYAFFEIQATNVLRFVSELSAQELPDVSEDFFRLLTDALLYYPQKLIPSPLFTPIFEAAISVLTLEQREPLSAALHYIRDLLSWGSTNPPSAIDHLPPSVVEQLRNIILQLLVSQGHVLVKRVLAGMMITFPGDCFADGSGALLTLFEIMPNETTAWVDGTIRMLPAGTIIAAETDRLMMKIRERLRTEDTGDVRQIRSILQDFTNTYRRRYVAPRDGLGDLVAPRFRFSG